MRISSNDKREMEINCVRYHGNVNRDIGDQRCTTRSDDELSSHNCSSRNVEERQYSDHVQDRTLIVLHLSKASPHSVRIWLGADVGDGLFNCRLSGLRSQLLLGNNILLWMASASLSGISMLNSSSMAITTSTVSKLSRPRSFVKWAVPLI